MIRTSIYLLILIFYTAPICAAATFDVPDGYSTIQAAIDAASDGDTVQIDPGEYSGDGFRDLRLHNKQLLIVNPFARATSRSNSVETLIRFGNKTEAVIRLGGNSLSSQRLLVLQNDGSSPTVFRGLKVTGGRADSGGVMFLVRGAVRFEYCEFYENRAIEGGVVFGEGGVAEFYRCGFRSNSADSGGVVSHAFIDMRQCRFYENAALAGGVSSWGSGKYRGCRFRDNHAFKGACFSSDKAKLTECILFDNGPGALASIQPDREMVFDHCIVARNLGSVARMQLMVRTSCCQFRNCIIAYNAGAVVECEPSSDWMEPRPYEITIEFSNLYENGEDNFGCLDGQELIRGNISADPRFVDLANDNFGLLPDSPCIGTGELGRSIGLPISRQSHERLATDTDIQTPQTAFCLHEPSPNPLKDSTLVVFDLPTYCRVQLYIFNSDSECVASLYDQVLWAGRHEIAWDGTGMDGMPLGSGLYSCRLTTPDWVGSQRILILK